MTVRRSRTAHGGVAPARGVVKPHCRPRKDSLPPPELRRCVLPGAPEPLSQALVKRAAGGQGAWGASGVLGRRSKNESSSGLPPSASSWEVALRTALACPDAALCLFLPAGPWSPGGLPPGRGAWGRGQGRGPGRAGRGPHGRGRGSATRAGSSRRRRLRAQPVAGDVPRVRLRGGDQLRGRGREAQQPALQVRTATRADAPGRDAARMRQTACVGAQLPV